MWLGALDWQEELMYTASKHTLSGGQPSAHLETKFHLFSDLGHMITSVVFMAPYMDSNTKFALSMLIPIEHLKKYLPLHAVVEDSTKLTITLANICIGMLQLVNKLAALLKANVSTCFCEQYYDSEH